MESKITLEAARINAGYKQEDVARMLGVRRETISNWENNNKIIKLGSLKKLCEIYKKDINEIFFDL